MAKDRPERDPRSPFEDEGIPDLQDGTPQQQWAGDPQEAPLPGEDGYTAAADFGTTASEQREGEGVFRAKLRVLSGGLRIDAEDLDAAPDRFGPVLPELAELPGSTGRIVARIEDEDDGTTAQGGERHDPAGFIGEREIGSGRADGQRIGEEPGDHGSGTSLLWVRLTESRTLPRAPVGSATLTCQSPGATAPLKVGRTGTAPMKTVGVAEPMPVQ